MTSQVEAIEGFWAVIPAGGAGTRLWPMSRRARPKFLLDLTGAGRTLLQATFDRLDPVAPGRVLVVTGVDHEASVLQQLPSLRHDALVGEPSPHDSMPAIGLAAAIVERRDPDAVIGSFAADHVIADTAAFYAAVTEAAILAREGELVTIGIEPTHPATGFGYIRLGAGLGHPAAPSGHRVDEFVEKPDATTAQGYLGSGDYRWNAGMFVVCATVLLELLADYDPEMVTRLREIAADPSRMADIWPALPKIAIDHAVAEPAAAAGRVAVVLADLGWDDVGDYASLAGLVGDSDVAGLKVIGPPGSSEDVVAIDATGIVYPGGRTVALVGVQDIVVVSTPDAVLVTTRERAQDIKHVIDLLQARDRHDLT